ncbi:DUF2062 domain-containing protein [Desulfocurvibacter africanus]|uniref:DUF2062 domain-containing protein n=1 Tax=Desulfocurvibacter africanus TaxID=873 RepID=UPI000489E01A|nr:DUF2062 domain-containing protein [Desulfocurvibacter africanus]
MNVIFNLKRLVRYNYLKVLRLKTSSHSIALGLALGVYGGCLPALPGLPLQSIIGLLLAFIFRASKIAALVGTWISNPLNWFVFYWAEYKIGRLIIPVNIRIDPLSMNIQDFVSVGMKGVLVLLIGGAILGLPLGLLTYIVSLPLIRNYRRRRALRLLRKRTSLS